MWNLDDSSRFVRVLSLTVPWARTYADVRPGKTDRERREELRTLAGPALQPIPATVAWWAFRITVRKGGRRPFDIENVPKPIIDSFCARQIEKDGSQFANLGLYRDDSLDFVRVLQVTGERNSAGDQTIIEIFGALDRSQ